MSFYKNPTKYSNIRTHHGLFIILTQPFCFDCQHCLDHLPLDFVSLCLLPSSPSFQSFTLSRTTRLASLLVHLSSFFSHLLSFYLSFVLFPSSSQLPLEPLVPQLLFASPLAQAAFCWPHMFRLFSSVFTRLVVLVGLSLSTYAFRPPPGEYVTCICVLAIFLGGSTVLCRSINLFFTIVEHLSTVVIVAIIVYASDISCLSIFVFFYAFVHFCVALPQYHLVCLICCASASFLSLLCSICHPLEEMRKLHALHQPSIP